MEERLIRFISGLRALGVRVSIAESEDALKAVTYLGIINRDAFRLGLRSTLIKEAANYSIFNRLFPQYFGYGPLETTNALHELTSEQKRLLEEALSGMADELRQLIKLLLGEQKPTPQQLQDLSEILASRRKDSSRGGKYQRPRSRQDQNRDWLEELLAQLWEILSHLGIEQGVIDKIKDHLSRNIEALEQQLEINPGENDKEDNDPWRPGESLNDLMRRPLNSLTATELAALREQVRRLAASLRTRVALRQKRGKHGNLDVKSTIRANLRFGGVPFAMRLNQHRLKPKLVTILDVSTSMRPVTEFFLRLLYELQDQVQNTRSFAFLDHLEEVTDALATDRSDKAIYDILSILPPGFYNTDLGLSLRQFEAEHSNVIDHRTTFIVLGDARNNYNDPALEVFGAIKRRARKVFWLNPEYPGRWGQDDSDMLRYAPMCNAIYQIRNMQQMTEAIDRMLVD